MANPPTCEMQANAKVRIGKDRPAPQSSFLLLADCNVGLPHVQHAVANLEAGIDALGSAFTLPLLEHCDVNHQRRSGEILPRRNWLRRTQWDDYPAAAPRKLKFLTRTSRLTAGKKV